MKLTAPRTRIYYVWLQKWGIPTSINRTALDEMAPTSNGGPFKSDNSLAPGSTTILGRLSQGTRENSIMSTSHSSPTYGIGQTSSVQSPRQQVHSNYAKEEHGIRVCRRSAVLGEVDNDPTVDRNSRMSDHTTQGVTPNSAKIDFEKQDRFKVQIQPESLQERSFFDEDSDYFDEGEAAMADGDTVAQGLLGHSTSPKNPRKRSRLPDDSRDSGYASKTNSMQPFEQVSEQVESTKNLKTSVKQTVDTSDSDAQILAQHFILNDIMKYQDGNIYDHTGNSFLLKLAPTGAPWTCFENAFAMGMEVNHKNALGQTFAHVLNVSRFHEHLLHCLSRLQELRFDFEHRDHYGGTVLHHLYEQPIAPQIALGALRYFPSPGRCLRLRDASGRTPYEIYQETYVRQASQSLNWVEGMCLPQVLHAFGEIIMKSGHTRSCNVGCAWLNAPPNIELRRQMQQEYKKVTVDAEHDIHVETRDGSNAIHSQAALLNGHIAHADIEELKKYISLGIDLNSYDIYGRTPLEALITQHRDYESELTTSEKVCLLVDSGASVHLRNRLGQTPIYSAAVRGLDRTVEALLIRKPHVNIRAADGKSLLAAVIDAGYDAFTEYLTSGDYLNSGEPVASERTPYHEAQCSRIEHCVTLLERAGAVQEPSPEQAFGYPHSAA